MTATVLISVTFIVLVGAGSEALPAIPDIDKETLISMLLQAPPVAEAACFVRDVNSAGVIVDKICDCDGSTVACDVGPVNVGDIQVAFCNKTPNQPLEDLLVLKFACHISDPTCGEGTVCDIGPIEYDKKKYYLCTYQTGILPPASGSGICHPAMNQTDLPEGPGPQPNPKPEPSSTTTSTSTSTTTSSVTKLPKKTTASPDEPVTIPSVTASATRPPWRPWNPPSWASPPKRKPSYPSRRIPHFPPLHHLWPPMSWGQDPWGNMDHRFGGLWGFGGGSQWHGNSFPVDHVSGPGVHVYERRRWRIGNKGGEVIRGKKRPHWHHESSSSDSSSEES